MGGAVPMEIGSVRESAREDAQDVVLVCQNNVCYECGGQGHFGRDSPTRKKRELKGADAGAR